MKQTKATLKMYFETGDKPTQSQFSDLIDSFSTEEEILALIKATPEKEYSYTDMMTLVNEKKLIAGQKYILSDYQTKYYIEGTSTAPIQKQTTNEKVVSGYGFYPTPLTDLVVGTEIEVVSLPEGYLGAIAIGDKTTVSVNYGDGYYLKFANGLQYIIGIVFKYSKKRYTSIPSNTTILDSNQKVVMSPNGVINTDVHNGTEYMQMKPQDNLAVPTEKIVLTAISNEDFSKIADSLTFPGEIVEFDIKNREIKNENGVVIGTRNGLISRRISSDKKIDIDKDWRVQRYRRYKLSETDWTNFILNNLTDHSVYNLGTINSCTLANINHNNNHKFIAPFVETPNFYQDFSNSGTISNTFLTGTTGPHLVYGDMMETIDDNIYKQNITVSTVDNGKDFFIFPINEIQSIEALEINSLNNTVFLNLNSQYIQSNPINVKITDGISKSTFMSGASILSTSENRTNGLSKITAIDAIDLHNKGVIENLIVLTTGRINNNGYINYLTTAGMPSNASPFGVTYIDVHFDDTCRVRNTIIGGKRVDRMTFSNVQTNKCLFSFSRGQYLKIANSTLFLTAIKCNSDFYSNHLSFDTTRYNSRKNKHGYLYDTNSSLVGQKLITNNLGDLMYQTIVTDQNNNTSSNLTTLVIAQ
jgi:hypothetical protein